MSFSINNTFTDNSLANTLVFLGVSVGDYKFSAKNSDIGNWLLCDGRSLSISNYPELYQTISTSFGSIDSEHFNIPDFRGRVFGPINGSHPLGQNVGVEEVTLTVPQMPIHTHTSTSDNNGLHNHTGNTSLDGLHNHTGNTSLDGLHSHTSNADGGYGGVGLATSDGTNTVINTDTSANELNVWTNPIALSINNSGSHNHTLNIDNSGSHNHSISTDGLHNHIINVSNTGGGLPHQNMQPTLFGGNVFILSKNCYYV